MSSQISLSHIIKTDHKLLNELYKNYLISRGNIDVEQRWSNLFEQALIKHLTGTEIILYPAFEKYLPNEGDKIVGQARREHEHMKKLLFLFDKTAITDPQYRLIFDQLITSFSEHIKRENFDLEKLESVITADLNASLAKSFEQTKESKHLKMYTTSPINPPL